MNTHPNRLPALLALAALLGGSLVATEAVAAEPRAADAQRSSAQAKVGNVTPTTFATQAAEGGLAEVQLSELARRQAGSAAVREFAERMVADHGEANAELEAFATRTLPVLQQHHRLVESTKGQMADGKTGNSQMSQGQAGEARR